MDELHLHHSLLTPTTTTTTTTFTGAATSNDVSGLKRATNSISIRIPLVLLIGLVSTWANHEASKGFMITVTNDSMNSPLGKKFSMFYVSNDEATRLVQHASDFAANILYPNANGMPEKLIGQVDIRFGNQNHDHVVLAEPIGKLNKYVLSISPRIMELSDFRYRVEREIQRGMAEILLFDLRNGAPEVLLHGIAEYITNLAGFGRKKGVFKSRDYLSAKCWEDEDPEVVAEFLGYCERENEGFIGRLNQEMREKNWDEKSLDSAIGKPAKAMCESFRSSKLKIQDVNSSEFVSSYR